MKKKNKIKRTSSTTKTSNTSNSVSSNNTSVENQDGVITITPSSREEDSNKLTSDNTFADLYIDDHAGVITVKSKMNSTDVTHQLEDIQYVIDQNTAEKSHQIALAIKAENEERVKQASVELKTLKTKNNGVVISADEDDQLNLNI